MWFGTMVLALTLAGQVDDAGKPKPEDVYCGSYSLFIALRALGIGPETHERLELELGKPAPEGYSMLQLDEMARGFGAKTIAVTTNLDNLAWRPERFACLTVINGHHYVLLYKVEDGKVFVCDAPRIYDLPRETFESVWSRQALLIGPRDFLPEEVIGARRAWFRRGRIALTIMGVVTIALVIWRMGRALLRRRAVVATLFLAATVPAEIGCSEPEMTVSTTPTATLPPGPSLIVEPAIRDLGRIAVTRPHQTTEGRASLRNVSDRPITIELLIPSCACTDVDVEPVTIEPGGTSLLRATIRLANNDDDGETRVIIHSSDPVTPVTEAKFVWEARNALHADVRSINVRTLRPGAGWHGDVPIQLDSIGLCRSCRFQVADDHNEIECKYEKLVKIASGSHARSARVDEAPIGRLLLDVEPSDELGHRKCSVSLSVHCGGEQRALLVLPVTWRVESAVAARPDRLYLGRYTPGERIARSFLVSSTEGKAFSILGVRCSDPDALATVEYAQRPAMVHTVGVEIAPPRGDGPWTSELIVDTDDEAAPRLNVPMAGLAAAGAGTE